MSFCAIVCVILIISSSGSSIIRHLKIKETILAMCMCECLAGLDIKQLLAVYV